MILISYLCKCVLCLQNLFSLTLDFKVFSNAILRIKESRTNKFDRSFQVRSIGGFDIDAIFDAVKFK